MMYWIHQRVPADFFENPRLVQAVAQPSSTPKVAELPGTHAGLSLGYPIFWSLGEIQQNFLKIGSKANPVNDALVAVAEERITGKSDQIQSLSDLPHERVNTLSKNAVYLPRILGTTEKHIEEVDSVLTEMKGPESLAESKFAELHLTFRHGVQKLDRNLYPTVLAQC
jgi:hypothetical protein